MSKTTTKNKKLFIIFSTLTLLLISSMCFGATYYVDTTNGNDNNDGFSVVTAWRTITKVNASIFKPGDQILFNRGQVWREQLIIPSSGSPIKPITFGAYGNGANPVIKGSNLVFNWVEISGYPDVRKAIVHEMPKAVWEDGNYLINKGTIREVASTVGSWYWDKSNLFVHGSIGYPKSNGKMYEAAQRATCISSDRKNYIYYTDLTIMHSNEVLFSLKSSTHNTLMNLTISGCAGGGVQGFFGGGYHQIYNCTIADVGLNAQFGEGNGIQWLHHDDYYTDNNTVSNCVIRNTGPKSGDHGVYDQGNYNIYFNNYISNINGAGLRWDGNNCKAYYNVIKNCSRAITINQGENHIFYNNTIYKCGVKNSPWSAIFYVTGSISSIDLQNNIIYGGEMAFHVTGSGSGFYSDFNCIYGQTVRIGKFNGISCSSLSIWRRVSGYDNNSLNEDPMLAVRDNGNIAIGPNSPCVDAGAYIEFNKEIIGKLVLYKNSFDIGAFEYVQINSPKHLQIISTQN